MSQKLNSEVAVIGIDIGKNSFHIVGQDRRGARGRSGRAARLNKTTITLPRRPWQRAIQPAADARRTSGS